MTFRFLPLFILFLLVSCEKETDANIQIFQASDVNNANTVLLEAVMEDAFTPPVASRIYAYSHLAHYITLQSLRKDSLVEITSKINGLADLKFPKSKDVNPELASLLAFSNVGKKLIYSEHFFDDLTDSLKTKSLRLGLSEAIIKNSEDYALSISNHIGLWIDKDNYNHTRTLSRFTSTKKPENWRETPPDYATGLEPHWDKIRTMAIDSANVFRYKPLPEYSTEKNSEFYNMVIEVYNAVKNKTEATEKTAWFWDCNPIMTVHKGHMVTTIHKFTPPGHWLNIVNQVSTKEKSDYFTTTKAYTLTSMAMFDAIIAAWHVKYKTDLVRPVTYIQENIDTDWSPVLQTPPFPEYTSGHSATSASAAEILSSIYGDNYAFTDNTQLRFGLEDRSFKSFREAANQVNLSRFYGGIHYKQGVEEGARQGREIANLILKKLQ
ncbi:vanadium-dependent haloperoxidase [Winogradskyella litorisediminis]|uniref:Vanadium-dependent haloperoxidase n=1 Tax=Winogradskyella litorisediminis TaxID=1156618 RepID=A0ABW3N4R6_9FLAO